MATRELHDQDDATSLLTSVRDRRHALRRLETEQLQAAVSWAAMHTTESVEKAATLPGCEGEVALAGPGAPLIAEFAVGELAAAMGLSTDAGTFYLGEAIELAHRLPKTYAQVCALRLPVSKARRIAAATKDLPFDGATYVDTHLNHDAHKTSIAQLDRSVEAARAKYDPAEAERRRREAAELRHVTIETHQVSFDGLVDLTASLDLADALDLDDALNQRAAELVDLDVSHDVRRSMALGDIARGQLSLTLNSERPDRKVKARQVVLYVHLHDEAIARLENTRSAISVEQVKSWCTNGDTQVVIKPVLDLAGHTHSAAYEFPERVKERQTLLQHSCVFPHCTRPARRADCDHIHEADAGGQTCDCNAGPLCRRHHRFKTHGRWRYVKLDETTFVWRSPSGMTFTRDHTGTTDAEIQPKP